MLDIYDLLQYTHTDCVIDIFDSRKGEIIKKSLTHSQALKWHEKHDYELLDLEPIQRKDLSDDTIFGIQFNVELK